MNSAPPGGAPKFCAYCGKSVPNHDGRPAKFCISCGKTLPASPASSAPSSPVISPVNGGGLRKASTTVSAGSGPSRPPSSATPSPTGLSLSKRTTGSPFGTVHESPKFNPTGLLPSPSSPSSSSPSSSTPVYTSALRKAPATPPGAGPSFARPDSHSSPSGSSSVIQRRATIVPGSNVASYRANATAGQQGGRQGGSDGGLEFLALAKAKADAHERARLQSEREDREREDRERGLQKEREESERQQEDMRRRNTVSGLGQPAAGSRVPALPQRAHGQQSTAGSNASGPADAPALPTRVTAAQPSELLSPRQTWGGANRAGPTRPTPPPPMTPSVSSPSLPLPRPGSSPSPSPPSATSSASLAAAVAPPFTRSPSAPSYPTTAPSSSSPYSSTSTAPPSSGGSGSLSLSSPAAMGSSGGGGGPPPVTPRAGAKKLPPPPPSASAKTQLLPTATSAASAPAPPSQASASASAPPPVPTSANRPELSAQPPRPPSDGGVQTCDPVMRERVIKEIIDTEEDYIRDLEVIINVYLMVMREQGIGTKDQINNIFSNIEVIYKINKGIFLPVLKTASVGKAFLTVVDYLKLYMVYCGNQDLSMQTLAALKANPKVEQILYHCSRKPECRSMDISSFLIRPIQRICKYPLLLRELLKNTAEDHPEHANLTTALQRMTSTVGTINEKKSDLDRKMRLYELSHKINLKGDIHLLDSPNRRLISEGELTRIAPKEVLGKKLTMKTQGYYFLFSDIFLFTKATSSSYDLKAQVPLTQALYKDSDIAEDAFELTQIGQKRVFFAAPSAAKKAEMKKELDEVIASFLDVRYKKFVQKEIAKTLAMQVNPVNPNAPMPTGPGLPEEFSVLSFDDWKHKLEAKPLPTPPPQDDAVRFVCNSPAPESEKRVIKLAKDNFTLPALQDQIRKKFDIGPAVGFRIVYPNNDGSWEMCPLNDQRELELCLEKKTSDLFLTWLA